MWATPKTFFLWIGVEVFSTPLGSVSLTKRRHFIILVSFSTALVLNNSTLEFTPLQYKQESFL